jgi:2-amino-4-hydroxy-6-hydroxymethyldihydropteridine diphosphokinase
VTRPVPGRDEVLIALGSNLEPREEHLGWALEALAGTLVLTRASSIVETPPLGHPGQGPYLNMVVRGTTDLEPHALLEKLLEIEEVRGRTRTVPGAARTLDLDLLFHGNRVIGEPGLILPHPRWAERRFVVEPLLEVAPGFRDPESGLPLAEAARPELFSGWIRRVAPPPKLPAPPTPSPGSPAPSPTSPT